MGLDALSIESDTLSMESKNSKVCIYPTAKTDKTLKSFIGDCLPSEVEKELLCQFSGREIESIVLLN